jgi:hypothetical protein
MLQGMFLRLYARLQIPVSAVSSYGLWQNSEFSIAIFMGGDVCHFTGKRFGLIPLQSITADPYTGDIRPTEYAPMPDPLPDTVVLDKRFKTPCPCSVFTACHNNKDAPRTVSVMLLLLLQEDC